MNETNTLTVNPSEGGRTVPPAGCKRLVVLTNKFGTNFSGGAIATCGIFGGIQERFELYVIANEVGRHPFRQLKFLRYKGIFQALRHIRQMRGPDTIFYGDFYMAYYFVLSRVPFYFTFHDNWPEMRSQGFANWCRSLFYVPVYRLIMSRAAWVFSVSDYKSRYIRSITSRTHVVRNGINQPSKSEPDSRVTRRVGTPEAPFYVMMLGNVERRKYGAALEVFRLIEQDASLSASLSITILGQTLDAGLAKELAAFPFVELAGFQQRIDFSIYGLCLSTSSMENLSIAVCDALANRVPVLAFDVGGLNEVVHHGDNGILIQPGQSQAMCEALAAIVQGKERFAFARQDLSEYNWSVAGERYWGVMGNPTHAPPA